MEQHILVKIKEKKIVAGFFVFLLLMWVCTLVSKSIYASKLPQVTVQEPEKRRIEHIVESEGIIKQGGEMAVNILAGIRVEKIYVRQGDAVEEGSLLLTLDAGDLEEIIADKELEAAKLEYQIAQLNENEALADTRQHTDIERAKEDYARAGEKGDMTLERAESAYNSAAAKLERHLKNEVGVTSKEERQKALDAYNQWLEEEKKGQMTVSGNQVEKPDYSAEDSAREVWETEKESLEENLKSASYSKQDADTAKADGLIDAGRVKEDAATPKQADNTAKIYQLELQAVQKDIKKYREIYHEEGKVISERKGTVTGIHLSPGERTPDGAAIICADNEVPFQFETLITKEQKKYVNQGDTVMLKTTQGRHELVIDYMEEAENNPGAYRAVVYLPENTGQLGMNGTLTKSEVSESYECCIPIDALHSEDNGKRHYIYLAEEREGILGKEMYVEMYYVNVLDRNDTYAALEAGTIGEGKRIITGSDKEIKRSDVIRLKD